MDTAVHRVQNEMACPVCGQCANYTWGTITLPYLRPTLQPVSWMQQMTKPTLQDVMVRTCNECSNIQFFKQNPPPPHPDL